MANGRNSRSLPAGVEAEAAWSRNLVESPSSGSIRTSIRRHRRLGSLWNLYYEYLVKPRLSSVAEDVARVWLCCGVETCGPGSPHVRYIAPRTDLTSCMLGGVDLCQGTRGEGTAQM